MKKLLTLVLAALLVCGMFVAGASAEESGLYQYTVNPDGTAEITKADPKITDGNIPAELDGHKVTSIGNAAFDNCGKLKNVVIPEGVESLKSFAFSYCSALQSVSLPDSLVSVGCSPFSGCKNLKTVEISPVHPVFVFNNKALISKQDMTLVSFLDSKATEYEVIWGIKKITDEAFWDSSLKKIILPDTVTEIGSAAFYWNSNLTEVVLPRSLTKIGRQAFTECISLKEISIPAGVTSIEKQAFQGCKKLASFRVDPENPVFEAKDGLLIRKDEQSVVCAAGALKGSVTIPEGIRIISDNAFDGCKNIKELIIPDSVIMIPYGAFNDCGKNLVIKAPADSFAQKYCERNGVKYAELK